MCPSCNRMHPGAVEKLQREFAAISAGRATPSMLDGLEVAAEGGAVPLTSLAKVLLQGPQALQVRRICTLGDLRSATLWTLEYLRSAAL